MDRQAIQRWAAAITDDLPAPLDLFLIGGAALVVAGLQDETKDIDTVVRTTADRAALIRAASQLGYAQIGDANRASTEALLTLHGPLGDFDNFVERTTHFSLSPGMIARAQVLARRAHAQVLTVHPQDILLLKTATGRPADGLRIASILERTKVDWDSFLAEVQAQESMGNSRGAYDVLDAFFSARVLDRLPPPILRTLCGRVRNQIAEMLTGDKNSGTTEAEA